MSFTPIRWIKNSIVFVWNALDFGRRLILNLILLTLIIVIAVGIFSGPGKNWMIKLR